jgi:hypothetical protein
LGGVKKQMGQWRKIFIVEIETELSGKGWKRGNGDLAGALESWQGVRPLVFVEGEWGGLRMLPDGDGYDPRADLHHKLAGTIRTMAHCGVWSTC